MYLILHPKVSVEKVELGNEYAHINCCSVYIHIWKTEKIC